MTPIYTVELWDINGVYKADISEILASGLRMNFKLNDVESLDFGIDLVQFERKCQRIGANPNNILYPYKTEVKIKRNDVYILGTQVVSVDVNFNNDSANTIQVRCTGYLNFFKDRYISAKDWGTHYENKTYAQMARYLIADTQSQTYGDFGITLGVDNASANQSATRTRMKEYDLQEVKDGIINLTKLQNDNFDFEFTPQKVFNVYSRLGSDKPQVELRYPSNIKSMTVKRDATALYNKIIGLGSGIGDERLSFASTDSISAITYRLREKVELFNNIETLSILQDSVNGMIPRYKDVEELPSLDLQPGTIDISQVKVGDAVTIAVDGSSYIDNLYGLYRIVEMNVSVDTSSAEDVSLTVMEWQ